MGNVNKNSREFPGVMGNVTIKTNLFQPTIGRCPFSVEQVIIQVEIKQFWLTFNNLVATESACENTVSNATLHLA